MSCGRRTFVAVEGRGVSRTRCGGVRIGGWGCGSWNGGMEAKWWWPSSSLLMRATMGCRCFSVWCVCLAKGGGS